MARHDIIHKRLIEYPVQLLMAERGSSLQMAIKHIDWQVLQQLNKLLSALCHILNVVF